VAPYLHAPLQSGSDRVLSAWAALWYTAGSYAAAVERLVGAAVRARRRRDRRLPGRDRGGSRGDAGPRPRAAVHVAARVFRTRCGPGHAGRAACRRVDGETAHAVRRELRVLGAEKAAAPRGRRVGGMADAVVISGGDRREGLTEDYLSVDMPTLRRARATGFSRASRPGASPRAGTRRASRGTE
jgi:hypothetical protein